MNLKPSPSPDRLHALTAPSPGATTTDAITEFFLLEECVARCESLAESIATERQHEDLIPDLSECIAACQTYLAAKARESRFESRLRDYCVDALAAADQACRSLPRRESSQARQIIRAGLRQLQSGTPATRPAMN